jgi:hypothetical protein
MMRLSLAFAASKGWYSATETIDHVANAGLRLYYQQSSLPVHQPV